MYEDFENRFESRQFVGKPPHTAMQPPHVVVKHNLNDLFIFPHFIFIFTCLFIYLFLFTIIINYYYYYLFYFILFLFLF